MLRHTLPPVWAVASLATTGSSLTMQAAPAALHRSVLVSSPSRYCSHIGLEKTAAASFPHAAGSAHTKAVFSVPNIIISRGFAAHAQSFSPDHPPLHNKPPTSHPTSHAPVQPHTDDASNPASTKVTHSPTSADGSSARLFGEGGYVAPHPGLREPPHVQQAGVLGEPPESFMSHPVYNLTYLESIIPIHRPPADAADRAGLAAVRAMRVGFDLATGYGPHMTEAKWLRRIIFLETVAGVPGMVAGMLRHLNSLRRMKRDAGWIHCLLEEAENERMHLMTFMELRRPGPMFRAMVLLAQGVFFNAYFLAYLAWPKACHAFVGYLEEEAVRTYTHAIKDIDAGKVWADTRAPAIAQSYWKLPDGASMRDLVLVVRADEACHSHVNHTLKALRPDAANPFANGKAQLP